MGPRLFLHLYTIASMVEIFARTSGHGSCQRLRKPARLARRHICHQWMAPTAGCRIVPKSGPYGLSSFPPAGRCFVSMFHVFFSELYSGLREARAGMRAAIVQLARSCPRLSLKPAASRSLCRRAPAHCCSLQALFSRKPPPCRSAVRAITCAWCPCAAGSV